MRKIFVLIGVILVALAGSAAAQADVAHPGFYPIEEMGIFAEGDLEVDVDLSGAMLKVAAGAMENQDESLAELVANLDRVRVQVGLPSGVDSTAVARSMTEATLKLVSAGWTKILSVEEGETKVYFYSVERDERIVGITGFVNEPGEEIVVINVAGDIDPLTLGRIISRMEDFDLDEIMEAVEEQN
jgi:hypothetical protein